MKRLREKYTGQTIRYYHSGEYGGTNTLRPHYHALLFNLDFKDLEHFKTINKIKLYKSPILEKIWGNGYISVGRITMQSAGYVARYIMKKQSPNKHDQDAQQKYEDYYSRVNIDTGEISDVDPEYSTMSRNIGLKWFNKYKSDVYPADSLHYKGEFYRPPKFYDRHYEAFDPAGMAEIKTKRRKAAHGHHKDHTIERLKTRERVLIRKTETLIRSLGD